MGFGTLDHVILPHTLSSIGNNDVLTVPTERITRMADTQPTPPTDLDADIRAILLALGEEDAETIHAVAAYTAELADWAAAMDDRATESNETDGGDAPATPEGVPDDATVSEIDIAGVEYTYYQWREGDSIRSETVKR